MEEQESIVRKYDKRSRETVIDSISVALTNVDDLLVEKALLEESGLLTELTHGVCNALPFAVIAAMEGANVLLHFKQPEHAVKDGAFRMTKSAAVIGVGAVLHAVGASLVLTMPIKSLTRAAFDRYQMGTTLSLRVQERTGRLEDIRSCIDQRTERMRLLCERELLGEMG